MNQMNTMDPMNAPAQDMPAQEAQPVTAQELSSELMEQAQPQPIDEREAMESEIREGVAQLFEDGWTQEELAMLTQDVQVREDVAAGKSVVRAAAAMLRRQLQAMRGGYAPYMPGAAHRHGVPVSRATASGRMALENSIEQMTDAQFDAFSRRAREAAMMGRKVRM